MTMYFTVIWNEPRFVTNNTVDNATYTPIDLNFLNHLWVPNIFIYDLRTFKAMSVLKKLAGVYIIGDSRVYYNQVSVQVKFIKFFCEIYCYKSICFNFAHCSCFLGFSNNFLVPDAIWLISIRWAYMQISCW